MNKAQKQLFPKFWPICHDLTLLLPRSSIDDLVFSVFTSNFLNLSYKISLLKNRFVTLFFSDFHKIFKRSRLFPHASEDYNLCSNSWIFIPKMG